MYAMIQCVWRYNVCGDTMYVIYTKYTSIKSLHCTPDTNIMYVDYIATKRKKKRKSKLEVIRKDPCLALPSQGWPCMPLSLAPDLLHFRVFLSLAHTAVWFYITFSALALSRDSPPCSK